MGYYQQQGIDVDIKSADKIHSIITGAAYLVKSTIMLKEK